MPDLREIRILKAFWNCGDSAIVDFAIIRARLNRKEEAAVKMTLDQCRTQEEIAEELHYSVRQVQGYWHSGARKLLSIPWVRSYGTDLLLSKKQ